MLGTWCGQPADHKRPMSEERDDLDEAFQPNTSLDNKPTKVVGPIYGIPGSEILAWVKSWTTDNRLPEPKSRRIR